MFPFLLVTYFSVCSLSNLCVLFPCRNVYRSAKRDEKMRKKKKTFHWVTVEHWVLLRMMRMTRMMVKIKKAKMAFPCLHLPSEWCFNRQCQNATLKGNMEKLTWKWWKWWDEDKSGKDEYWNKHLISLQPVYPCKIKWLSWSTIPVISPTFNSQPTSL